MKLRPARLRDALALRSLHLQAAEDGGFYRLPEEVRSVEEYEADIARYARSENSAWFVAVAPSIGAVGGLKLTGGALVRTRHAAHFTLMVERSRRHQGIGRSLLEHALQWARDAPMLTRVGLSVFSDNAPAIALYRSLGFAEEGLLVGVSRERDGTLRDDLRMALSVE